MNRAHVYGDDRVVVRSAGEIRRDDRVERVDAPGVYGRVVYVGNDEAHVEWDSRKGVSWINPRWLRVVDAQGEKEG